MSQAAADGQGAEGEARVLVYWYLMRNECNLSCTSKCPEVLRPGGKMHVPRVRREAGRD